jgi:hypothetical protein
MAILDEPLKDSYRHVYTNDFDSELYRTNEVADAFSFICDMGQAIPDLNKEGWYENKPISGVKLELRAKLVFRFSDGDEHAYGFVVITKNGEILKTFKPLGEYVSGEWKGDFFNHWKHLESSVEVFSEESGKDGYANFNLIDGIGFYYESQYSKPKYFLSNCRRIKKTSLPVYEYRFPGLEKQ